MTAPIVFVVPGLRHGPDEPDPGKLGFPQDRVKSTVRVGAARDAGALHRLEAVPGEDVVVLHIANGPPLVLHPETARELMRSQSLPDSRSAGPTPDPSGGVVECPAVLSWAGLEDSAVQRSGPGGWLGGVLLSAVQVIKGLVQDKAAKFVARAVVHAVDGQVDPGVYRLHREALKPLKGSTERLGTEPAYASGGPFLVLVHGTFVETTSTFSKLWARHPRLVADLFDNYGNRVYALDHPTLGVSPIANALTLARALPKGASVDLLTHSRGGLVAEVLARVCARPQLTDEDAASLEDETALAELRQLVAEVAAKGLRVRRMVRVACPARGTLLASKRLDAYLSVFRWTLELAGVPVAPAILEFLTEVAALRADPSVLPGLAAMIPDSPLVKWLHSGDDPIIGDLRVVAGDMRGDSVVSWIKTLLADAFYWTDNDLVVQTRSMYGGVPRSDGASFVLDAGATVNHFNYFSNDSTASAIVAGLTEDRPRGYRTIGPLSWAGKDVSGVRAARPAPDPGKPAVFLLPGILGTNLKVGDKRIWLSLRLVGGFRRLRYLQGGPEVEPDGPIGSTYDALIEFLSKTHEVIPFGFDWRLPMEEEAGRLAREVGDALERRVVSRQPVRLLAHSMGGLLARTLLLEHSDVFERMMAHGGARLVMLGTPNRGSWAPMQVLSGDDTFGNALSLVGAPFHDADARAWMAEMPGFLQLQAGLLDPSMGLDRRETWQELADRDLKREKQRSWHSRALQIESYRWGVPPEWVLQRAVALRRRLDDQEARDLQRFAGKLAMVLGHADRTPDGFDSDAAGFAYRDLRDNGDGRVTHKSALLPGVRTWFLDCTHGDLPDQPRAFRAFLDLLERGETDQLSAFGAGVSRGRGAETAAAAPEEHVRSRPSRSAVSPAPPRTPHDVIASVETSAPDAAPATALRVSVVHGNLKFVREPLMVGHYRSLRLSGAERVVDTLIGGTMGQSLKADLYPDKPGSNQVFINRREDPERAWRTPRPEAVIVAGLGEESQLKPAELSMTVARATVAWAQRLVERKDGAPADFELAATLIGSGGMCISPGGSAQAIAQGVREANAQLSEAGWPIATHVSLVEVHGNRATEAWQGLQVLAAAMPGQFAIDGQVRTGVGGLSRSLDVDYRGADYDFATALMDDGRSAIHYSVDTKRARTQEYEREVQIRLLDALLGSEAARTRADGSIGRTLFFHIVPIGMDPFFGSSASMVLTLDKQTARLPWELLETPQERAGDQPWAIRCKLIRKLRLVEFRENVADATADDQVLVVGDPVTNDKAYPPLPGAREEAKAVAELLAHTLGRERVTSLVQADAGTIARALPTPPYRIVHIAGHGKPGDDGGVVLSGGALLGWRELEGLRIVPELVFVNCCHLGAMGGIDGLSLGADAPGFAANVAHELISIGVRCVVAAGWAVDDRTARIFAQAFYAALLDKRTFMEAVAIARSEAWQAGRGGDSTWAAYQCYGDPDWRFLREPTGGPGSPARSGPDGSSEGFTDIPTKESLLLALETLTTERTFGERHQDTYRQALHGLDAQFASLWGRIGSIAEAFGRAYAVAEELDAALKWLTLATEATDGTASMKAGEQLGNLRARRAWERLDQARIAGRPPADSIDQARKEINEALTLLKKLCAIGETSERASLCASAYKRLAMVEGVAQNPAEEERAIEEMAKWYGRAEERARSTNDPDLFYSAHNRISAALIAGQKVDPADFAAARAVLKRKLDQDPDFWGRAEAVNSRLYESLAGRRMKEELGALLEELADLHDRVAAPRLWASVLDHATFVLERVVLRNQKHPDREAAKTLLAMLAQYAGHRSDSPPG